MNMRIFVTIKKGIGTDLYQYLRKSMIYQNSVVRIKRLELLHLSAPEPKSGASTNFAISAFSISVEQKVTIIE